MKHPHAELLKQLIEDMNLEVQHVAHNVLFDCRPSDVLADVTGNRAFCIKPQPIKRQQLGYNRAQAESGATA